MKGIGTFVVLAVVFLALVAAGVSTSRPSGQTAAEVAAAKADKNWAAYVAALRYLKRNVHDPSSFELTQVLRMQDQALCIMFRARNGFGALRLERFVITEQDSAVDGHPLFPHLWNRHCDGKSGEDITYIKRAL